MLKPMCCRYGSNLQNYQFLQELHAKYPNLPLLATEATLEAPIQQTKPWYEGTKYGIDIIGDLNQHSTGWIEWNVLLDKVGGPTCQVRVLLCQRGLLG